MCELTREKYCSFFSEFPSSSNSNCEVKVFDFTIMFIIWYFFIVLCWYLIYKLHVMYAVIKTKNIQNIIYMLYTQHKLIERRLPSSIATNHTTFLSPSIWTEAYLFQLYVYSLSDKHNLNAIILAMMFFGIKLIKLYFHEGVHYYLI